MLFYIIRDPRHFQRLRAEVDAAAGAGSAHDVEVNSDKLVELKFLQAVINEALRLQPIIPNGVQRTVPKQGGPVIVAGQ
jgi:cytochrome P450